MLSGLNHNFLTDLLLAYPYSTFNLLSIVNTISRVTVLKCDSDSAMLYFTPSVACYNTQLSLRPSSGRLYDHNPCPAFLSPFFLLTLPGEIVPRTSSRKSSTILHQDLSASFCFVWDSWLMPFCYFTPVLFNTSLKRTSN